MVSGVCHRYLGRQVYEVQIKESGVFHTYVPWVTVLLVCVCVWYVGTRDFRYPYIFGIYLAGKRYGTSEPWVYCMRP